MGVVAAGAGHSVPACPLALAGGELLDLTHTAIDRVRRRHDKVGEVIGHPVRWAVVEYLAPLHATSPSRLTAVTNRVATMGGRLRQSTTRPEFMLTDI